MGGTPFSEEIFNTREEFVSTDMMSAQNLLSRDMQDVLAAATRSQDSANAVPGNGTAFDLLRGVGTPISGLDLAPTLTPAAGLTMTLGAGSGYSYYATGVSAQFSTYQVLRWPQQVLTFASGGGNPRIDTVYANIGSTVSVTSSRNVLVDPVARTVTVNSVNKQQDPLSNIIVQAGTPAANPLPAASGTPGAVPLFYVYVPAGAGGSSQFAVARGAWRRAPFPYSASCGLLATPNFIWDLTVDPTTTSAAVSLNGANRVVIDGEVIEWVGTVSSTNGGIVADTANSPFGSSAPSTWVKPYYMYAVGGRNNPTYTYNSGTGTLAPIIVVESTTPPDLATGRPTATLTLPSPWLSTVQAGACYIGLGFVVANTTRRAAVFMDGQFSYFGSAVAAGNTVAVTKSGGGTEATTIPPGASALAFETEAIGTVVANNIGGATSQFNIFPDNRGGAASPAFTHSTGLVTIRVPVTANEPTYQQAVLPWLPGAALWVSGGLATDIVQFTVSGFKHRVKMIGGFA